MGFAFTAVEPNQLGRVTKWDVPINQWLGLKLGGGHEDTLGTAVSRATEDFIWDDDNPVRPDVLNKVYGIDGQLSFDSPMSVQRARLIHERKRRELERLSYLESASHSWFSGRAVAGFGAALIGGMSHPLDAGLTFLPFIGSEKASAGVAKMGAASWRQSLQRGLITEESLGRAGLPFHRLTASVIDGTVNQAVMEIPIAIQKHRDRAIYGIEDAAFNILAGGAFAGAIKGVGLALERAARLWTQMDPRMREATLRDTLESTITDNPPKAHWALGMDEATIRAKVEERVRDDNPLDESGILGRIGGEPATAKEIIEAIKQKSDFSETDARIVARLIERLDAGDRSPELFDVMAAFTGKTYDAQASLKSLRTELYETSSAIAKSQDLLKSTEPSIAARAKVNVQTLEQRRVQLTEDIRRTVDGLGVRNRMVEDQRQQSAESFLAKSKADHEAKLKDLIDLETRKTIDEVRRQSPPTPKEQTDRYTLKNIPDDANIKAMEEDAADLQESVLNLATTSEQRALLESELNAELKALDERNVSGEKAVDEMIPCVAERAKQ